MTIQMLFFTTIWTAICALLGYAVVGTISHLDQKREERTYRGR